jgi:dihydroflavonol-4-reductase
MPQGEQLMRAFVTGSTGLLGSNLVRLLRTAGHQVTALVRSRAKAARIFAGLDVALIEGDMADVTSFAPALAGHDVLFHTAAFFREYYQPGDHWPTLKAINVDGTITLLRAAEAHRVGKVIYTSSTGLLGKGSPATEATPPDALVYANLYFRSKLVAEQEIAAFQRTSSLPLVQILPGWMFGPGDSAPTSSGQIVLDFLNQRLPVIIPGSGSPVDARDVAQAMIAAVDRGRSGERYIVGGDQAVTLAEILRLLEEVSGVPGPRIQAPGWFVLAYAYASEAYARISQRPVLTTVEGIRTLADPRPTSSAKAVRELGVTFRPLRDTLRDEVAWLRAERPELLRLAGQPARA